MNKTLLAILIVQISSLPLLAQDNVLAYSGGFAAIVDDKLYTPGNTSPEEYTIWKTATHYTTFAGSGYIDINRTFDTVIDIEKGVSGNRDGDNDHLGVIDAEVGANKLTINNLRDGTIQQTHNEGSAIHIKGNASSEVIINGGTYSKTGIQSREAETGIFSDIGSLTLNKTTFYGATDGGSDNQDGGAALFLTGGNTIINFDEDVRNNILQGGNDGQASYSRNFFDGETFNISEATGGAAIKAAGGTLTATNLYGKAGTSAGFTFTTPVFSGATISVPWGGGHGIEGSLTTLNMYKGSLTATDSGSITVQPVEQNHSWTGTFTTLGGSAVNGGIGAGTINGATLTAGNGGAIILKADVTGLATLNANGGFGIDGSSAGSTIIDSVITAGNAGVIDDFSAHRLTATLAGGTAFNNVGNASTVVDSWLTGGNGGNITGETTDTNFTSIVSATAGAGFSGALLTSNSVFKGGNGGEVILSGVDAEVVANGGDGARISGTSVIHGGTFSGGNGGTAFLDKGISIAGGGSGVFQAGGTLTINGGTFSGGKGGLTSGDSTYSSGGHGAFISSGDITITGGTFRGGYSNKGLVSENGRGLAALNSSVTLDGKDAVINNGLLFTVESGTENLNLLQAEISGGIDINMNTGATTDMTVSDGMNLGTVNQMGGLLNVKLSSSENAELFRDMRITDGKMTFSQKFASITGNYTLLSEGSTLSFAQGAELNGAAINAGMGTVETTSGDLVLGKSSSIKLSFETSFDTNGVSSINGGQITMGSGNLVLTNSGSMIRATGIAAVPNDTLTLSTGSILTDTNLEEYVSADFGWLVNTAITNDGGIKANLTYKPLAETELSNINSNILTSVDAILTSNSTSEAEFYGVNAAGSEAMRFSLTQLPEVSETVFKVSHEINKQIAARGTEHRSMNGFASSKPKFSNHPEGVAGPDGGQEKTLQGWIRGYSAKGKADSNQDFSGYESGTFGTVMGVDKSFGNVLIGIAGGMARTDLDGAYEADVDTYHGTVYSTIGGERIFVDVALTYGQSESKESGINSTNFDSDMMSLYLGAGMTFEVKKKFALTPEISLTATDYKQDGFTRNGVWGSGVAKEYETTSYLGSIGANLSSLHQMDWLNRSIAFIPELRLHWLHEFDNDPDDFQYNVNGVGFMPFSVRSRDENTARIGVGFDTWSWKHQSTKFEIDYDALFSDTYFEHVLSGKITWQF